ncbi:FIG01203186: hypothetical protein, partial [hydrothermal vent metagenome]
SHAIMKFYKSSHYIKRNEAWFNTYKALILTEIPSARVEHIGASAIAGAISKGDLDIFVGISMANHLTTINKIEQLGFKVKENTLRTKELCMLESISAEDIAIQVVVNGSEFESFVTFRDILLTNHTTLTAYNQLKQDCSNLSSAEYRKIKSIFIEQVLKQSLNSE